MTNNIRSLYLVSHKEIRADDPVWDDIDEQHLTISSDGRVDYTYYMYHEIEYMKIADSFIEWIDREQAEHILELVDRYFTDEHVEPGKRPLCCWTARIDYADRHNYMSGSLAPNGILLEHISNIIRKVLDRPELLCFDGNLGAEEEVRPGRYRHFKGNEYRVFCSARHSETAEKMVVYQALYGEQGIWVRPESMWNETVEREGRIMRRFEYIGE